MKPAQQDRSERRRLSKLLENKYEELRKTSNEQQVELARLRAIDVEHARLEQANKRWRVIMAVDGFIVVGGGTIMTALPYADHPYWFSIGLGLVAIASLHALTRAVIGA